MSDWVGSLLAKKGYNKDQPRVPAGSSDGGQFASTGSGGGGGTSGGAASTMDDLDETEAEMVRGLREENGISGDDLDRQDLDETEAELVREFRGGGVGDGLGGGPPPATMDDLDGDEKKLLREFRRGMEGEDVPVRRRKLSPKEAGFILEYRRGMFSPDDEEEEGW